MRGKICFREGELQGKWNLELRETKSVMTPDTSKVVHIHRGWKKQIYVEGSISEESSGKSIPVTGEAEVSFQENLPSKISSKISSIFENIPPPLKCLDPRQFIKNQRIFRKKGEISLSLNVEGTEITGELLCNFSGKGEYLTTLTRSNQNNARIELRKDDFFPPDSIS